MAEVAGRNAYKALHHLHILQKTPPTSHPLFLRLNRCKMSSLKQLTVLFILAATSVADIYPVTLPQWSLNGPQSGIGSWYRASAGADATNGKSWCAYQYFNSDPIFAPVSIDSKIPRSVSFGPLTFFVSVSQLHGRTHLQQRSSCLEERYAEVLRSRGQGYRSFDRQDDAYVHRGLFR